MYNIFLRTAHNVWPMLFIFTIIIVSIRLTYLLYNNKKIIFYKEITMLCFIIYILLLYYVVTFQDNNYGTNNFVPFREIFRYDLDSKLFIRNVLGNVLLFVPFGIFVTYYVKVNKVYIPIILSLIVSCAIEFAQSLIGRTADIDDVILNVLGGIIGYLIFKFGGKLYDKLPRFMKSEIFLDALSLAFVLVLVYLAFRFNFWRILSWIILK